MTTPLSATSSSALGAGASWNTALTGIAKQANAKAANAMTSSSSGSGGMVYNDLAALTDLKTQSHVDPNAAVHEVAKQFESLFVTMMMKTMRESMPEDSLFNGSGMKNYQEMYDQQLALNLSSKGGLGLASVIERQLSNVLATSVE
jgi:Rod binding domain-containing protein